MTAARTLCFVVPEGLDDPARVSGGNVYDARLADGLRERGWELRMPHAAPDTAAADVGAALAAVPPGGLALVDGLVARWAPDAVVGACARVHLIVLAHMVVAAFPGASPDGVAAERRALGAAERVIASSGWTAAELLRRGVVAEGRVAVARPGAFGAPQAAGPVADGELLCVGVIAPHKGQDVLLDALALLGEHEWACTLAGSTTTDPGFAARVREAAARFPGRVRMPGVLSGGELDRAYRRAAVLVAPSRVESFGMAVADALARGLPAIASDVGGIGEAASGGGALLVRPGDPKSLARALHSWLDDPAVRAGLRAGAEEAALRALRWSDTAARVDRILASV